MKIYLSRVGKRSSEKKYTIITMNSKNKKSPNKIGCYNSLTKELIINKELLKDYINKGYKLTKTLEELMNV